MKKIRVITLTAVMVLLMAGCSKGAVTQANYNAVKTENTQLQSTKDTLTKENTGLKAQVDTLTKEKTELKAQVDTLTSEKNKLMAQVSPTEAPIDESMSNADLEAKLLKEPMYVVSTDLLIQSKDYKSLYPDMLNAIIKNNSGTDIKNAVVSFAAWDKKNFPVKIKGQYDLDDGKYVHVVDFGDVNMADGDTFGKDGGLYLNSDTNNIKTIKAIVKEYTDFNGKKWENPYYKTWVSSYENKKLAK